MRQTGKQILTMRTFLGGLVLGGLLLLAGSGVQASTFRINGDIVVDPLTGYALGGYDPVSYFTDPEPLPGRREFEILWGGVPWLFASEGNMDIFLKAPQVYAPQFGGHGVMSLARGFLSDGNPLIYKVQDNRLYLFYSFSNREAFELSDKVARLNALQNWQALRTASN